ncbi:MAG: NAD(P)H-dependent oxidoreductase subunit E [Alphaproteobacteria bacterium]|nr:NAD(P)H-dependent oxidoreductase subunit E [Alphaproteobacteria bacterium]
MDKIKVKICRGTTCFVMGGDVIKSISDTVKEKYGDKVEIETVRCLKMCQSANAFSAAPYVYIDGTIISSANVEKVVNVLESKLNK